MTTSVLCEDILEIIMALAVNSYYQDLEVFASDASATRRPKALVTLIRLSHVNVRWRSLALLSSTLWARNLVITPNMSAPLLDEILARTRAQDIHLRVVDPPPQHPIWPRITQLFERCISLGCQINRYPHFMNVLTTTPAPSLQSCTILCDAPPHATSPWRPLFAGRAPALRRLRLSKTSGKGNVGPWMPHISSISPSGLIGLGDMKRLTHLELHFETDTSQYIASPSPFADLPSLVVLSHVEDLKLSGSPFVLAHLLQAVDLPALSTISVVYVFSSNPVLEAVTLVWEPLLRHFPSADFPTFRVHCGEEEDCRFHFLHANGRELTLQFDDQGLGIGMNEGAVGLLLPVIHVPPIHLSQSQIIHGVAWVRLISLSNFVEFVRTVVVSTSSPKSTFPYHLHFLLSAMAAVDTIRFDDCISAYRSDWYDLLRDTTGLFGHHPLPNISTISLPTNSLEGTLSNIALHDLLWDHHESSPLGRLHFASVDLAMPEDNVALTILGEISKSLPVMISFEAV